MSNLTHKEAFQFITNEELKEQASSIFTAKVADRVLKNYIELWTPQILDDLRLLNWKPVRGYQVKPKLEANNGYQKHFIHLRNDKVFVGGKNNIELIPEIIVINSYDARSSFKLVLNIHRVVSDSGLIIGDAEKISHREIDRKGSEDTRLGVNETALLYKKVIKQNLPQCLSLIEKLKAIQLDRIQQRRLAEQLCKDRWDYKYQLAHPERLTTPSREEDKDQSAWTVYCKIHEKILKGGWVGAGDRAIKPLKDPNREIKINIKMFDTMSDFISKLK